MRLEAELLNNKSWGDVGFADKLRKAVVIAPVITFFYCLLIKKGLFDGKAGLYYAIQRATAETILSMRLLQLKMNY